MTEWTTQPDQLTERRVRVTLEGTARSLGAYTMRVTLDDHGGVLMVDRRCAGVSVETIPEPYTWTEGDVVMGTVAYTRQEDRRWRGTLGGEVLTFTDEEVEQALAGPDDWQLLRYQANPERVRVPA